MNLVEVNLLRQPSSSEALLANVHASLVALEGTEWGDGERKLIGFATGTELFDISCDVVRLYLDLIRTFAEELTDLDDSSVVEASLLTQE